MSLQHVIFPPSPVKRTIPLKFQESHHQIFYLPPVSQGDKVFGFFQEKFREGSKNGKNRSKCFSDYTAK